MEVLLLFVLVIGLMLMGVPIAVSLGFSSIVFLLAFSDSSLGSVAQTLFEAFEGHSTLLAIPFFILASSFMSTGGVAQRIIRFSIALVGHFRGGLAIAGVLACMIFAALSGSSPATVVAIGTIVIAAMRQVGYTKDFAAGVIANAGTLGILIPPSIVMVVYAAAVEVSVGRMFLAGILPGLLAGLFLMIGIYVMARIKDMPAGEFKGFCGNLGEFQGCCLGPAADHHHNGRNLRNSRCDQRHLHTDRSRSCCVCICVPCGHVCLPRHGPPVRRRIFAGKAIHPDLGTLAQGTPLPRCVMPANSSLP
jgi:hypothetical protein